MKLLAVDDEIRALNDLKEVLTEAAPESEVVTFSSPAQALEYSAGNKIDIAFLDVEIGRTNGIILAKQLKDLQPDINIIFVTGFGKYAVDAFAIHATGYLLKPARVEDVRRELTFIYGRRAGKRVRVQTFGGFAVFVDDHPVTFQRNKSKELLAYLVDRRGADITTPHACSILWEHDPYDLKRKNYFQSILLDLRKTLRDAGVEHLLIRSRNSLAIDPAQIECDSYLFIEGDPQAVNSYRHDYLIDYSWAEFTMASFEYPTK